LVRRSRRGLLHDAVHAQRLPRLPGQRDQHGRRGRVRDTPLGLKPGGFSKLPLSYRRPFLASVLASTHNPSRLPSPGSDTWELQASGTSENLATMAIATAGVCEGFTSASPRLATVRRRPSFVPSWFYPAEVFPAGTANHEFPKNQPSVHGSIFDLN